MKPDRTVSELKLSRRHRWWLWLKHFAKLAVWGADEGGHDPVEQERIDWTRNGLFEDWWLHSQSILTNESLTDADVAALLKTSYEKHRVAYDQLLERERVNGSPIWGTHYETS